MFEAQGTVRAKARGHTGLVRKAAMTLVRMGEMTRDVASKEALTAKCVSEAPGSYQKAYDIKSLC